MENELLTLFNTELKKDIPLLEDYLADKHGEKINSMAHKYKVRLHYLGHLLCYEICLNIEEQYKEGDDHKLMQSARKFLGELRAIQNRV